MIIDFPFLRFVPCIRGGHGSLRRIASDHNYPGSFDL